MAYSKNLYYIALFLACLSLVNSTKSNLSKKKESMSYVFLQTMTRETPEDEKVTYGVRGGIDCSSDNCPYPNVCNTDKTACYCAKEMANYPEEGEGGVYCTYKRKDQLTCFLLELLLNSGIGHIIRGKVGLGVAKLILAFFIPTGFCFYLCITCCANKNAICGCIGITLGAVYFIGFFVWWLVDVIKFGKNTYKDKHGVTLKHW
ncbi:MAG: hypothetical protein MJ252_04755 [archaeon]|nr:hypothetical protein [archaeon]